MTHIEMIDEIIKLGLKKGDLVRLKYYDGDQVYGRLADNKVYFEEGATGEKINCRIGILPPPPPAGYVVAEIPVPVYVKDIAAIFKG